MAVPIAAVLSAALETTAGFAVRAAVPYWARMTVRVFAGDLGTVSNLTRISIPRLDKIISGRVTATARDISALRNTYGQYAYDMMRAAGAPHAMATKYKYSAPGGILNRIEYLDKVAQQVNELFGVKDSAVRKGMSLSEQDGAEWKDNYDEVLKLKKAGYL